MVQTSKVQKTPSSPSYEQTSKLQTSKVQKTPSSPSCQILDMWECNSSCKNQGAI